MMFGYVRFSVLGDSYSKFYNKIIERKYPCMNLKEKKGVLTFRISVEYAENIKALCENLNLEYEVKSQKGLFTLYPRAKRHIGIIVGVLLIISSCIILSNFVLRVKILSDDSTIKKDIISVLKENDAYTGSYIPNLNCVVIERELKQKVEGISWAGISISGSTLTIDIVENIAKPELNRKRLPSNLVAKRDAVIEKAEVFDGQLMTTVGSAVLKGETLVSGIVINEKVRYEDGKEVKDTHTRYVRSLANIYGTFEDYVNVFQPFIETNKNISDKTIYKRYLKIFDVDIPLFLSIPKGEFTSETDYDNFSLFGFDFPVGLKKLKLNEVSFEDVTLTEEETKIKAYEKLKKYETNYFDDYEIRNKDVKEEITEEGVKLNVTYTLYGDISEENEFFIEK